MMRPLNDPPHHVPHYPGEMPAIEAVEAAGWTVWWHNTGFGHIADATAVHPTNPASPMRLTSHEYPNPTRRVWWWRPMVQVRHVGEPWSPHRIGTYMPGALKRAHFAENLDGGAA